MFKEFTTSKKTSKYEHSTLSTALHITCAAVINELMLRDICSCSLREEVSIND